MPAADFAPADRRRWLAAAFGTVLLAGGAARAQAPFDHLHAAWTALLQRHVVLLEGGRASRVRYAGLAAEHEVLKGYLATLSAVEAATFAAWDRAQRMAFLVNAYNAFTVELVLTRYPKLASIKDLGSLLQSPWKPKWIALFGERVSLDDIEHGMLRARGRYDDPRIHFAVNCASIGCPMLREEAFVAARLERQLDEQTARFLGDRSRNRFEAGRLRVSRIFDWYGDDFRQGHLGIGSLEAFFARHAERLADAPADRALVAAGRAPVAFLDYDWALNDAPAGAPRG